MSRILFENSVIKVEETETVDAPEVRLLANLRAAHHAYSSGEGDPLAGIMIALVALEQYARPAVPADALALVRDLRFALTDRHDGINEPFLKPLKNGTAPNKLPTNTVVFRARIAALLTFTLEVEPAEGAKSLTKMAAFVAETCVAAGFKTRRGAEISGKMIKSARDDILSRPPPKDLPPEAIETLTLQRFSIASHEIMQSQNEQHQHDTVVAQLRREHASGTAVRDVVHSFIVAERKRKPPKIW